MKKVEIVFLLDDGTWNTDICKIPEAIADTESQDAFITWLYGTSPEAQEFVTASVDFTAAYIVSWHVAQCCEW